MRRSLIILGLGLWAPLLWAKTPSQELVSFSHEHGVRLERLERVSLNSLKGSDEEMAMRVYAVTRRALKAGWLPPKIRPVFTEIIIQALDFPTIAPA